MKRLVILFFYFILGLISPLIISYLSTIITLAFISIISLSTVTLGSVIFRSSTLVGILLLLVFLIAFLFSWIIHHYVFYKYIISLNDYASRKVESIINKNQSKKNLLITIWWFISFLFWPLLIIYSFINHPSYRIKNMARSSAAKNTLATIAKECAVKIADAGIGTTSVPKLEGYRSNKKNIAGFYIGNDRKTSGAWIVCPTTGEIKLISEDESKLPSYVYNIETGEKTCRPNNPKDTISCRDGKW